MAGCDTTLETPSVAQPAVFPKDRNELLDYCKIKGKLCAEIGVLAGNYSAEILKRSPCELYLVDPYEQQPREKYFDANNHEQEVETCLYEFVKNRFKDHYNVHLFRMYSHQFFREVDRKFDWIYLDGNHSRSHVTADLFQAYMRIKDGGWICGHDYGKSAFIGVRMAVDDFCKVTSNVVEFVTPEDWGSFAIKVK